MMVSMIVSNIFNAFNRCVGFYNSDLNLNWQLNIFLARSNDNLTFHGGVTTMTAANFCSFTVKEKQLVTEVDLPFDLGLNIITVLK